MSKETLLKEFDKLPLCYDDGIVDNENDVEFIRGQAHFKSHYKNLFSKAIDQTREETLKEIIREYQDNELDGKGYDFYFSIRTKIDKLKRLKKL